MLCTHCYKFNWKLFQKAVQVRIPHNFRAFLPETKNSKSSPVHYRCIFAHIFNIRCVIEHSESDTFPFNHVRISQLLSLDIITWHTCARRSSFMIHPIQLLVSFMWPWWWGGSVKCWDSRDQRLMGVRWLMNGLFRAGDLRTFGYLVDPQSLFRNVKILIFRVPVISEFW